MNGMLDAGREFLTVRTGPLLAMIRKDPDLIITALRTLRVPVQLSDRKVDSFERPMGKGGPRSTSMRLFVVPNKVYVHNGQAASEVHCGTDRNDLAQSDANK